MTKPKTTVVYSVAGYSRSGKTTLVTELIRRLTDNGYSTATIKDCPKDLTLDTEGKDTWMHKDAGAVLAVLTTNIDTAILFKEPLELEETIELVKRSVACDLILVEGHKKTDLPKIWVPSDEDAKIDDEIDNIVYEYDGKIEPLLELLTGELKLTDIMSKLGGSDCGKCGYDTCHEMAEQVLDGKDQLEDCKELPGEIRVELTSAGEPVSLNKFASNVVAGMMTGIVKELKGIKDPENIEIKIKKKQ